jgi:hypothetical protein
LIRTHNAVAANTMLAYFNKVYPTYLENWNTALRRMSVPQTDIPLTLPEVRALQLSSKLFKSRFGDTDCDTKQILARIAKKTEQALLKYPGGAFIRLGSRSAKDSTFAHVHGLRINDAVSAVRTLTCDSHRIAFDLHLALKHNYLPHIFVREWQYIPAWSEFRCFMRDRKLIGISQYDCKNLGRCPEIVKNTLQIEDAINLFFKKFCRASHLDDVVFDVFIEILNQEHDSSFSVKLLEINPFFEKTDACLFSWGCNGDFDGSFRFVS